MSYKFEEGKEIIINELIERLHQKMSPEQADLCSEFVRQFYSTVAMDDLCEWDIEDLYGSAVNLWSLIYQRKPDETKIRIYNPDFERHGWQTTHTVVEVITTDMPFLVDSLRMVINKLGLELHIVTHMGGFKVKRDSSYQIDHIFKRTGAKPTPEKDTCIEAIIFIEIDRQTDPAILEALHRNMDRALEDTRAVVEDWQAMREAVRNAIKELDEIPAVIDKAEAEETKAFLHWIEDHHFTFLGIRDYELIQKDDETLLQPLPETGLGVLRPSLSKSSARNISAMTPEARELTLSPRALVMFKTNTEATVHRQAYADYIGIKRFNKKGEVIGERRIIGLYTSAAYNTNPKHIPFLRHKVACVMNNSSLDPRSHAGKVLLNILETLPRDDLIQASEDDLLEIGMGIYHMQERKKIRMFPRVDVYRRFISCLVYVPKERFNTELREAMQKILGESFNALEVTFSTSFTESVLARINFIIRTDPEDTTQWNMKEIEQKLIEVGRSWSDDLLHFLMEGMGEELANRLFADYRNSFPGSYKDSFSPRTAVYDIKHIEALTDENPLVMNFYRPMDESPDIFRLKIYQHSTTIPLSDVLPIVERLGMRAINERPYELKFHDGRITWISDFTMQYVHRACFDIDEIKDLFQNAFASIWFGETENDGFNQLVLAAGLNWRQVAMLRAYAKYFKQIGFTFSQEYIETALYNNAEIAKKLVYLFEIRFNPYFERDRGATFKKEVDRLFKALDDVANLDEDKIVRQYVHVISETLRTNFYQVDNEGKHKNYISIKLNSKAVPSMPKPYPLYEIFVYSPRFEGVHLRGGKVARGGLRWSERKEDFRTEILGLMKAQQVKNAVIVPSGAKGGFVPKRMPVNGSREDILAEGIACYQDFIRGLLDITDNLKENNVIKPEEIVCYDDDDPYLVVAADKGTATFSDIANAISLEYGFWLGDAFASGGSVGYDHKKMGITAKGAWESVKRHFYEIDLDINRTDFTVVGIGDMAGDVFGNGMLLSKHIKLIAAFNHLHIFIDPNPNAAKSFKERERLFNLPRSSWSDYDKKLISKGGGVFSRSAKSILVSQEMKDCFGIKSSHIEPNELIRVTLRAKVDLLWSAGIGTFVKASAESNSEVGDRTNDSTRVNGSELQCRVVGEGGNLGLTQLARIEYALNGGLIYTDFIDNAGGVNCSDREVNIKILLNSIVRSGDLTVKQRNELLSAMTDEVAELVLYDNFIQPRAISYASAQALRSIALHGRYINDLERSGKLDREIEFLPDENKLAERKLMGKGLEQPSIAVLLCYSKTILKEQILATNVPEDDYLKELLVGYFPKPLQTPYCEQMQNHPLKREIIATRLSNTIVNEMGFAFVYRMQDETGAPISAIIRAYIIARMVLDMDKIWKDIFHSETKIDAPTQATYVMIYVRLMRRVTRWFLRNQRKHLNIGESIKVYREGVREVKRAIPEILEVETQKKYVDVYNSYLEEGLGEEFAHELTASRALFSVTDVIEVAHQFEISVTQATQIYFNVGEYLDIAWIRSQVIIHPTDNNWESLSREALRDDLDWQQRQLAAGIIASSEDKHDLMHAFNTWSEQNATLIERWRHILADLRSSPSLNYTMFFVAIRELLDLTQTTLQMSHNELVIA